MVDAPNKNYSPLQAGKYGKSKKLSSQWSHSVNEDERGFEAERVRALGALLSLQSKKNHGAEKRRETHFLSNVEKHKCIEDYVEGETAGARNRVENAGAAVQRQQEDTRKAENVGLMNREAEMTFQELMVAIGDSLSDIPCSDDGKNGEDEDDEETEQGRLSEDDKPRWMMGTIKKMVQQRMERLNQKLIKLEEWTQPG